MAACLSLRLLLAFLEGWSNHWSCALEAKLQLPIGGRRSCTRPQYTHFCIFDQKWSRLEACKPAPDSSTPRRHLLRRCGRSRAVGTEGGVSGRGGLGGAREQTRRFWCGKPGMIMDDQPGMGPSKHLELSVADGEEAASGEDPLTVDRRHLPTKRGSSWLPKTER